ncbi:MAG: hypothetical protein ACOX3U_01495 [Christensenellales bacterium]|jgi:hypothetical protein
MMSELISTVKDYFNLFISLNTFALSHAMLMAITFIGIIAYDYLSFSGKIIKGSRRTIKFFKQKGWVDNSNVSSFLMKCMRHFPYVLRANFSLYSNNSGRPLTDYINEKCYLRRDRYIREKAVKNIYDFVLVAGAILAVIHIMILDGINEAVSYLVFVLCFVVLRYVLMLFLLVREIYGKKYYFKALDLMTNGIFLSNIKRNRVEIDESFEPITGDAGEAIDAVEVKDITDIKNAKVEKTH